MKEHIHKFQWFYLTFLLAVFIGVGFYYFIHLGHYPIATVNGKWIAAKDFNNEYSVAFQYYAKTLAKQKQIDLRSADFQKELRRAALNDLIDKSLINAELKQRTGSDFDSILDNKIGEQKMDSKALADAARLLYGMNVDDFKVLVLIPQAEKELLDGRLFLEQRKLDEWLADAEKMAHVIILTPEFGWATNKVVLSTQ